MLNPSVRRVLKIISRAESKESDLATSCFNARGGITVKMSRDRDELMDEEKYYLLE